jgi:phosphate transport system permease protein
MSLQIPADTLEQEHIKQRHQRAKLWKAVFVFTILVSIIALATLLLSVINQTFGLVAIENKVDPSTLSSQPLETLPAESLIQILESNLTKNRIKTLNTEKPLAEQSQRELLKLVIDNVVKPTVVASFHLDKSILNRTEIETLVAQKYPTATIEFRSWLNWDFIQNSMNRNVEFAGVRTALLGSLYLILITILVAFPIGVGAAIYLEEYARQGNWLQRIIQTNIDNLAGVPSIVYGILGLALFVRALQPLTSGAIFGIEGNNGRTLLAGGLTMALLILPILIINAQEAIRAVPNSLREASNGLGATKWQTIWYHVLPYALPGIMTGTILAISRAIGETAPLIVVGASTYITQDPTGPFSNFTALPIQIYNWTSRPQDQFRNIAGAAILVLLALLLTMNAVAVLLRNKFQRDR